MEDQYTNEERYNKAQKRVEEIKGFYGNLTSYIFVNIGLLVLNLVTSPNHLWFFWPLFGWGIGVAVHAMKVFNYLPFFGEEWEQKKIKELIENEKQSKNSVK